MINIPPIPSNIKIRTEPLQDITKSWKVGQLLNATVESNAKAQDNVLMRVGQAILEAKTPIALKAGEPIKLLIKSAGKIPVLVIQTSFSHPAQLAAQNLKKFIAQQQDLTSLLQLSQKIIENPSIAGKFKQQLINLNQQLPAAELAMQAKTLRKIIQNSGIFFEPRLSYMHKKMLEHNTLQRNSLIHDSLKYDIKSQLLRISAQLQNDAPELTMKSPVNTAENLQAIINQFIKGGTNLIQLSALLTNQLSKKQSQLIQQVLTTAEKNLLPKELFNNFSVLLNYINQQADPQQIQAKLASLLKIMDSLQELKTGIDGVLAKITSHQLIPLTRETDNLLLLFFDLCLKDKTENHLIQFRLEQEKSAENKEEDKNASNWTVVMNFNFRQLGPVQAQLFLMDNRISTAFRAEKKSTVKIISEQINLLDTAFRHIGFDAVNLNVNQGGVNQTSDIPANIHILDEKA